MNKTTTSLQPRKAAAWIVRFAAKASEVHDAAPSLQAALLSQETTVTLLESSVTALWFRPPDLLIHVVGTRAR